MGPEELNKLSEKKLLLCHQTVVHARTAKSSLVPLNSTAVMCTLLESGTGPCSQCALYSVSLNVELDHVDNVHCTVFL